MLWSLLKIVVFVCLAAALAYGAALLLETPGEVVVAFAGREFALTPLGFVLSLVALIVVAVILLKILGFLGALIRFLLGDETAKRIRCVPDRRVGTICLSALTRISPGRGKDFSP